MIAHGMQQKRSGLTLEKLASYDDVITDALVDKVGSPQHRPAGCNRQPILGLLSNLLHLTGLLLDYHTQEPGWPFHGFKRLSYRRYRRDNTQDRNYQ
jgi:hypothetical protein